MNPILDSPVTLTIVIATLAVTIVAFRNASIFYASMLDVESVLGSKGQWWRILTSGFVHADYPHLIVNMLSLFFFGRWFEHAIAGWRFALVYALGIIVGSFASLIAHRRSKQYRAVGASGGVCAIVGAATVVYPDLPMMIFPLPIPLPAWIIGALFIAYSVFASSRGADNIGHEAHLGGTFAGLTLISAFFPGLALEHWPYVLVMILSGASGIIFRRINFARNSV